MTRALRLSALSEKLRDRAAEFARYSQHMRAFRAVELAKAAHHAAGGDTDGAKDALREAAWLRRAAKKGAVYA